MRMRALYLAAPAVLAAMAGVAFVVSSSAMAGDIGPISDSGPSLAQATPPAPPSPPGARSFGDRRERLAFSPRAICQERVARRVGFRAYLKMRLDLKPEQMAAWSNFEKAADDATAKQAARCAAMPAESKTPPTFVDRLAMREEAIKARLGSMEAVKPSMLALYNALTPEQKAVLDRPDMGFPGMGFGGGFGRDSMPGHDHGPR